MSTLDTFDRVLQSLHQAMLDQTRWSATSALIDEVCGATGNGLAVGEGFGVDTRVHFAEFYNHGERDQDSERLYFKEYHPYDERLPRCRQLPDSHVVPCVQLYSEEELKTSRVYNEWQRYIGNQKGLHVRLDGPQGSRIVFAFSDPVGGVDWHSDQLAMIERLLPHVRQYVRVRSVVEGAQGLGASLVGLLENSRLGVIHLDRNGQIVEANDRAHDVLRQGDGLLDQDGLLRTRLPDDNARLDRLLTQALPRFGETATSGSITVRRPPGQPHLAVHITPIATAQRDYGLKSVAALVLVLDVTVPPRIDRDMVASVLGLTPSQSQVAAMLTEGQSVQEIAAATGRQPGTVRVLLKQIYSRRNITNRADLVRLVLALSDAPGSAD
ncbi:MAG: LuxR C-terminal-related transcriptional regulator [Candidatus Tectomicrobia bacterium]|nr:LuxR C-terminal-related transcriptional regulator [Candidatus Tectomicrobia bacterium]